MKVTRIAALALVAVLSMAAAKANWTATVNVAPDGTHVLGNPDAKVKLTEYVSYTCPHCAHFQKDSETTMRLAYVMPGNVSVKIHHVVRDPVDLTVAMLTNCGDKAGFFRRHHAFMYDQEKWLVKLNSMSEATRARWSHGPVPARLKAIANDFGFYATMEKNGLSRTQVDRCLSNEGGMKTLVAQSEAAVKLGVPGTPSFALNGTLIEGKHSWDALQPEIVAALKQ